MRIGIFPVMAGRNAGGPETYEHSLIRQLATVDETTEFHVFCFNRAAAESFRVDKSNWNFDALGDSFRPWSMSVNLPIALVKNRIDLLHATYMPPPISPVDYVFTLHCSSPFVQPQLYPPLVRWRIKALFAIGMRRARHILCVSQDVLNLAADYYKVSRDRMSVVYNGVGEHFKLVDESDRAPILKRLGVSGRYILFTGRFEPRKNVVRILEAFHAYRHETHNSEMKLVLAGNMTWAKAAVAETIHRLQLAKHVVLPGHVANEDLPALYSGAEFFVFPSLWEGFGIPIVEAMACGTPVITSNVSSLPEIAGDAALLVDPYSVDAITDAMLRISQDSNLCQSLRQRGFERARQFSWRQNAQQTLAVYRKLAS